MDSSEHKSVDISERVEDEAQYDHMGDDKFIVDATPIMGAGRIVDAVNCQRCGGTKTGEGVGDTCDC